ncbi:MULTISPECIES: sulfite exporter TauE/SafE family protein [Bacillaceae]|uniref:Probable membrane transporter protein n=1 Tax=Evansella alkalicola TaxID=745819 RepID=A0ABS6JYB6_9BACI|nr:MULTISPECIES: sulfite exporter TauE/SafE family protein [Bacillaceae]MBU9723596.1 sulfite exporter TauE/SafE family protein [Bacillus alkalicola]
MLFDLSTLNILIVLFCAILIGISKTGIPTLGILVVAAMATVFPARESIGIVLPMLITADLIAVTYYRRSVNWKTLLYLVPWVLGGITAGYILLFAIEASRPIEVILGLIILTLIIVQFCKERFGTAWNKLPHSKTLIIVMGTLAGFTTMIGNAAGPIMAIFLLAIGLPKNSFIGTGAWFFLSVNLIKVPLYSQLGLITLETLTLNLWLVPIILIGTFIGIKLVPLISQKHFNIIVLILAAMGGIRLLLP